MTATVAVTGATGFLGRAFVEALLEAGDQVVALARASTDRSRLPEHGRLTWVEYVDLAASEVADQLALHAPTAFVHLGWAGVSGQARGSVDHVAMNVPTTIAAVRLARAAGCSYWLGVGSQAEYGPTDDVSSEDSPLRPVTDYGIAKVAAAAAAHAVGDAIDITTGWARVFSIYGPGDHGGAVIPYAIRELLAGRSPQLGACTHDWDLLHVEDAARAFAALVRSELPGPTNVASGVRRPLREAIDAAAAAINGSAEPRYGDAEGTPLRASNERLRLHTGWEPAVLLEADLAQVVDHLRQSMFQVPTGDRS